MNPLHVLLVNRGHWFMLERINGQFAYPVPEFTWEQRSVPKGFVVDLKALKGFDLVWWDDGKYGPPITHFSGRGAAPVVAHMLHGPHCQGHYEERRERARLNADAVALDTDNLARWKGLKPFQVSYSVNERYYQALPKTVDVGHYCVWQYTWEREALDEWLEGYCKRRGWTFGSNRGQDLQARYAAALGRCRVVVHLSRVGMTRPARLFDVAAAGGALLSNPMVGPAWETWTPGVHYAAFKRPSSAHFCIEKRCPRHYTDKDCEQVAEKLDWLIGQGHWEEVAAQGQQTVLAEHTWAVRAPQLRQKLNEVLGL